MGLALGPHARANRTRDTRVAEPRLPAPENERPGEGQRLTPDAPHNGVSPAPPGTAPHHPRGTQPPQGMQAEGTVLGTQNRILDNNAWRTPAPKEGSRREESTWPRTLLATGSPMLRGRQGEHLMITRTCERRHAEPALELSHSRPTAPTAGAPAMGSPQPDPCS